MYARTLRAPLFRILSCNRWNPVSVLNGQPSQRYTFRLLSPVTAQDTRLVPRRERYTSTAGLRSPPRRTSSEIFLSHLPAGLKEIWGLQDVTGHPMSTAIGANAAFERLGGLSNSVLIQDLMQVPGDRTVLER